MSETASVVKLSHNQHASDIRDLLLARAAKKKSDADSRAQEGVIKTLRSVLFLAMRGSNVAKCGNAILTIKPEKVNIGCLTLKDGRKIPLSEITDIVIADGKDVIRTADVQTWFGGSKIGADLEITLTGDAV